jgi:hypothetical protein
MDTQLEIIYPISFDVQEKKDPLKTLLQSIIKPWKVEFSQDKENMLVENFIKVKKLRFLQDIKTLISSFDENEISQTISLFQDFKNLLSSFYTQNSQGYKIRNDLISDILQILREMGKIVQRIPELEETPENLLLPKEEFLFSKIDTSQTFQNYINSIIEMKNQLSPSEQNQKESPYSFVFGYLEELTNNNSIVKNSNYFKMCLFYYSALTLSQSLKGENQDGSPSQDQLINDLCRSFDQFNDELTAQEKEIFLRSVKENFLITDIDRLIGKFLQELEKNPQNQEKLKILEKLENFKEYLEAENNLNSQLFLILSKKIIDQKFNTPLTQHEKEDFIRYLDSINIEDPDTKAQLNKNFTFEDLFFLKRKCFIIGILDDQNTEKLNSIIVNKIEDFLLTFNNDFLTQDKLKTFYIKLHLEKTEIMDKFVEKLKTNSELNSKTIVIAYSSANPDPLENILLKAIERKHFPRKTQPDQSITSVNSSPARLQNNSDASSITFM